MGDASLLRDHSVATIQVDHCNNVAFGAPMDGGVPLASLGTCSLSQFNMVMAQQKLQAEFQLVSCGGAAHNPIFKYILRVDDSSYEGNGPTKKMAKNDAARAYFESISPESHSPPETDKPSPPGDMLGGGSKVVLSIVNYVGNLQELCLKSGLTPPDYTYSLNAGSLKHIAVCTVGEMTTRGEHPVKKEAKKMASMDMICQIKKKTLNNSTPEEEGRDSPPKAPRLDDRPPLFPLDSISKKKIASFQKILNKSVDLQTFLMETDVHRMEESSCEKLLFDLSRLYGFEVALAQQEETPDKVVIAQLGVCPVIVVVGIGLSLEEARANASKNVLTYLKALLK